MKIKGSKKIRQNIPLLVNSLSHPDYPAFLSALKERILRARISAARAVNGEMIMLYWDILGEALRRSSGRRAGGIRWWRFWQKIFGGSFQTCEDFLTEMCGTCGVSLRRTHRRNFCHKLLQKWQVIN